MTDIIARVEAWLAKPWTGIIDTEPACFIQPLLAELKAARAENEWLSNNLQVMASKYKDLHERLTDALVAFHHDAHNTRK